MTAVEVTAVESYLSRVLDLVVLVQELDMVLHDGIGVSVASNGIDSVFGGLYARRTPAIAATAQLRPPILQPSPVASTAAV